MKTQKLLFAFCLSVLFLTISCESDDFIFEDDALITAQENETSERKQKGKTSSSLQKGTYTIINVETPSALYKFTVKGRGVLLQSDPSVGTWGTDYFGFWSSPFTLNGNRIEYTNGLSTSIYEFNVQSNGDVHVVRTVIVAPYQSNGETTTSITNLGTYSK